jgi:hypothetical protein
MLTAPVLSYPATVSLGGQAGSAAPDPDGETERRREQRLPGRNPALLGPRPESQRAKS